MYSSATTTLINSWDFAPSIVEKVRMCHGIMFVQLGPGTTREIVAYDVSNNTEIGRMDFGTQKISRVSCESSPNLSVGSLSGTLYLMSASLTGSAPNNITNDTTLPGEPVAEDIEKDSFIVDLKTTGNVFSFVSSVSLFNNLLDYLYGMFEDFWFYKYHAEIYPEIVENFTEEMDLLNFLKIRPSLFTQFPTLLTF